MDLNEWLESNLHRLTADSKRFASFGQLDTNLKRVEFILTSGDGEFRHSAHTYLKRIYSTSEAVEGKSDTRANECRTRGNAFYARRDMLNAFRQYTLSLLLSVDDDNHNDNSSTHETQSSSGGVEEIKPIVLALSNRSAVLYEEREYEACLDDIEQVRSRLSNSVNKQTRQHEQLFKLLVKLAQRQVNCHFHMHNVARLRELSADLEQLFIGSVKENASAPTTQATRRLLVERIAQLDGNNTQSQQESKQNEQRKQEQQREATTTTIGECVSLEWSSTKGRHCVAKRDIAAGECLFVELPYAATLLPHASRHYCDQCMRRLTKDHVDSDCDDADFFAYANIHACSACTSVVYCSRECKTAAAERHRLECGITKSLLHNMGVAHLAYRVLAATSHHTLLQYAHVATDATSSSSPRPHMDVYTSGGDDEEANLSYAKVFHLLTHEAKTHAHDLFKYALTALLLAQHYTRVRSTPTTRSSSNGTETTALVASLLMRHLLQTICNAHAITCLDDHNQSSNSSDEKATTLDREQTRYASAIYPLVSMLNHSCEPNVVASYSSRSALIYVKAAHAIRRHHEILNCYGPHRLKMSLFARRQALLDQYRFACTCSACSTQLDAIRGSSATASSSCGLRCRRCERAAFVCVKQPAAAEAGQEEILVKCAAASAHTSTLAEYAHFFERAEAALDSIVDSTQARSEQHQQQQQLAKLDALVCAYERHLMLSNRKLEQQQVDDLFAMYYVNYSKTLDAMARINCELKRFDTAARLTEANVRILRSVYKMSSSVPSVEVAHELFKLAEIQCNCGLFVDALASVDEAIHIARLVYAASNDALAQFHQLRTDILSILKR